MTPNTILQNLQNRPEIISAMFTATKEVKEVKSLSEAMQILATEKWIVLLLAGTAENPTFVLGRIA